MGMELVAVVVGVCAAYVLLLLAISRLPAPNRDWLDWRRLAPRWSRWLATKSDRDAAIVMFFLCAVPAGFVAAIVAWITGARWLLFVWAAIWGTPVIVMTIVFVLMLVVSALGGALFMRRWYDRLICIAGTAWLADAAFGGYWAIYVTCALSAVLVVSEVRERFLTRY